VVIVTSFTSVGKKPVVASDAGLEIEIIASIVGTDG
jgi:hypothetical protein